MEYIYLDNEKFLKDISKEHITILGVKITTLRFATEVPIRNIEGKIKSGNINVDGESKTRRTGSLSIITDGLINDVDSSTDLGINKKIKIEIGYKNTLKDKYPEYSEFDTIWFPIGLFVITSFSIKESENETELNISFQDKMCLLDGSVGGVIPDTTNFNKYTDAFGNEKDVLIYNIIQEMVNHFGFEDLGKILISDIPRKICSPIFLTDDNYNIYIFKNGSTYSYRVVDKEDKLTGYYRKIDKKYQYFGYVLEDFVYVGGDLVANGGDSVVSILDKINSYLGNNFEYFYDINGNFIFREKRNYLNTRDAKKPYEIALSNNSNAKENNLNYMYNLKTVENIYDLQDDEIISSYDNTFDVLNIKNDFIIRGQSETQKSTNSNVYDICYHLTIDNKPIANSRFDYVIKIAKPSLDLGYYDLMRYRVPVVKTSSAVLKSEKGLEDIIYYIPTERSIYVWNSVEEQYKILTDEVKESGAADITEDDFVVYRNYETLDWRTKMMLDGSRLYNIGNHSQYYYNELIANWGSVYDIKNKDFYYNTTEESNVEDIKYYLDFIDADADISKFNIDNIGRRQKVVLDSNINCVFSPDDTIPPIVFKNPDDKVTSAYITVNNYTLCDLDGVMKKSNGVWGSGNLFNSAYDKAMELLFQNSYYKEEVKLDCIPLLYLEPNTIVKLNNQNIGVNGKFLIKNYSYDFSVDSKMNITTTQIREKL